MLHCCGLMCAVCGCKSIIYRRMHCSLWNLSIIDSASPCRDAEGAIYRSTTEHLCVCFEHLGVYAHVKKRLERGWRKTHDVRKEHCAVQCSAHSLWLPLSFKYLPTKGLSPSFTYPHPSCPTVFISLAAYLSFSILLPPPPALLLYSKNASVALKQLNCSEWPCQYTLLIWK